MAVRLNRGNDFNNSQDTHKWTGGPSTSSSSLNTSSGQNITRPKKANTTKEPRETKTSTDVESSEVLGNASSGGHFVPSPPASLWDSGVLGKDVANC